MGLPSLEALLYYEHEDPTDHIIWNIACGL